MKTPDDIKKGLECGFCHECPYDNNELETVEECSRQVLKDALACITKLVQRLAQAERERDALMYEARGCYSCKHKRNEPDEPPCVQCTEDFYGWEWRGVCEENSK